MDKETRDRMRASGLYEKIYGLSDISEGIWRSFNDHKHELKANYDEAKSKQTPYLTYDWKEDSTYKAIIANKAYLPLIRREYVQQMLRCGGEFLPLMLWEDMIRNMTGGSLKFEEVPAISSDAIKRGVCCLNSGGEEITDDMDVSGVRTGKDYLCGYIQRIDNILGDNLLEELVANKIL
ncbi:hypothetical protein KY312_00760 [Candidatus Woesearchaeota archaeon]|nr:hypothetical protein [Candidatus Woesearchaeota archaeon]